MSAPLRGTGDAPRKYPMRPPQARPLNTRALSAAPVLSGRASPAESMVSTAALAARLRSPTHAVLGVKRKERDYERETTEETNINVVVRCRGRNDREVKENSGVVVSTDGIKGNTVELSMGANAVSNKTYHFDKVFSPAADQSMIFDDVVAPILDEVLAGFNCTIFAYGQTGTGKTYTMSGDIADMLPLPDAAGIIPRVLHALFEKLDAKESESSVKCSFIELYNEELRDLLSKDESVKLKIYDDASKKSQTATLIHGMEETHIKDAPRGIDLLRIGSHKRQVAATKCNDLSSRSHTVFTITLYVRKLNEAGEELVSAGKLNLVDLAGSENIQRSGAENKRATEAGLINKSLLTLGRVINALVDKSAHVPYRESKLTRLLQDSLGGRTKTCIIATLSPAKTNLEETISTLDYAFRAKNIRNKPQTNQLFSKKTLMREFTVEIEKLKSELIATRHRNGVYLSPTSYEELTTESESRRILSEEQRDKIETMEVNLRNKAQELFSLTNCLSTLKRDNESVTNALENTSSVLEKTEIVLEHTRQSLAGETTLRKAHQETEANLADIGHELIHTLDRTTSDLSGLNSKLRRRSHLQQINRSNWASSQQLVADTTSSVERVLEGLESKHRDIVDGISSRIKAFVDGELEHVAHSNHSTEEKRSLLRELQAVTTQQAAQSHEVSRVIANDVNTVRGEVQAGVREGLNGLAIAAQKLSAGVIAELEGFHAQLHASYGGLGHDLKVTFDDLLQQLEIQRLEADHIKVKLLDAQLAHSTLSEAFSARLDTVVQKEKEQAAADRAELLTKIGLLVTADGDKQEKRLDSIANNLQRDQFLAISKLQTEQERCVASLDSWTANGARLLQSMKQSQEDIQTKIKHDSMLANTRNATIQTSTKSVHEETVGIVNTQTTVIDKQLEVLDRVAGKIQLEDKNRQQNSDATLSRLHETAQQSLAVAAQHSLKTAKAAEDFAQQMEQDKTLLVKVANEAIQSSQPALANLRAEMLSSFLTEYHPTGQTPQRTTYQYVSVLPRTAEHDLLLGKDEESGVASAEEPEIEILELDMAASPSKALVYNDFERSTDSGGSSPVLTRKTRRQVKNGIELRELDINVATFTSKSESSTAIADENIVGGQAEKRRPKGMNVEREATSDCQPVEKASSGIMTNLSSSFRGKTMRRAAAEGRENVPLSASIGTGRRLRKRDT